MKNKTAQILTYITKKCPGASITSLMKFCYFIDLISMKENGQQLTEFEYKGYYYGPFDSRIYSEIEKLVDEEIIITDMEYTANEEYIGHYFNEEQDKLEFNLSEKECDLIDRTLEQLRGYGAKAVSEIAYKTKPMLAIGAKLGGREHINRELNLSIK